MSLRQTQEVVKQGAAIFKGKKSPKTLLERMIETNFTFINSDIYYTHTYTSPNLFPFQKLSSF